MKASVIRILILCSIATVDAIAAKQRFAQLSFVFPNKRVINHQYIEADNILSIEFKNTTPNELTNLDHYDEKLIRRVLVKDLSPVASRLDIVLADRNVRASLSVLEEPFRVVVDLFDRDYSQPRDPMTGLPVASDSMTTETDSSPTYELPAAAKPIDIEQSASNSGAVTRKLLQAAPTLLNSPNDLATAVKDVDPGVGKSWREYPPYIYRLQTAAFIGSKDQEQIESKGAARALTSGQAMADYAAKLFDFGHEGRALVAFQQVLYKAPEVFEKDPLALWKFAESHMGQSNLTLADGYYGALIEKHPQSELSEYAKLRRLDIEALKLTSEANLSGFAKLVDRLSTIASRSSPELQAQILLRKSFWNAYGGSKDKLVLTQNNFLPTMDGESANQLRALSEKLESQRTSFLTASLILKYMLDTQPEWQKETGIFASSYFDRFSGSATEPFRIELRKLVDEKLIENFQSRLSKSQFTEAVNDYETLSNVLQEIDKNPIASWTLAEANRRLGQSERAMKFYQLTGKSATNNSDKFKANFWLAVTAGEVRLGLKTASQNPAKVALLGDLSRAADRQMELAWSELKDEQKSAIATGFAASLEQNISSEVVLKSPAQILLGEFTRKLSTKLSVSNDPSGSLASKSGFSPNAQTIFILSKLAKRFSDLGMPSERQQALSLLQFMKPSDAKDDANAKKLWASQLSGLAEEYREQNRGLEAGRLFAYTGANAEDYAERASSLYKGGLLLYRAGRRDEAIASFKTCSEDTNNRYYANLCLERLDRLNNQ